MIYQKDYIMREIESLLHVITDIYLEQDKADYIPTGKKSDCQVDKLYQELQNLWDQKKINEAENLLFEKIEVTNRDYLKIAVNLYRKMNQLSDEELEKYQFSREEISQGLKEVMDLFGIVIL